MPPATTDFNAVVYPEYYNGEWDEWTGKGRADEERFDLDRISGRAVGALVEEVRGLVEDATSSYVIVNSQGRDEGVCSVGLRQQRLQRDRLPRRAL